MDGFFTHLARFGRTAAFFVTAALIFALAACPNPAGEDDPEQYTITFDSQEGSAVDPITADEGTKVPKPTNPTRTGYEFQDWFNEASGGTAYTWPHALTGDVTMYARWQALSQPPSIAGTAKVGETLTANAAGLGGTGTISYQWQRGDSATGSFADISGANSQTYTLAAADLGKYLRIRASRGEYSGDSTATGPVAAATIPDLSGTVSITGTAKVGETLTADTAGLGGTGAISYQWERSDSADGNFTEISSARNQTYTLAATDLGNYLRVTVSRAGHNGTKTSDPTTAVAAADLPPLSGTVSIAGTAIVGETLTANTASLGGTGAISYQWERGDSAEGGFENIPDANSQTYTLVATDQGNYLRVTVSRAGHSGVASSTASAQVTLPDLTGTVSIAGTAKVGETLTAVTASLGGSGTISYQWQRGDSAEGDFTDISDAHSQTYTPVATDLGNHLRVTVSRSGYGGAKTSDPTTAVAAADLPPLSGTVSIAGTTKVGETLTADTAGLEGTGTISYQWQRGNSASGGFENISGEASGTYLLVAADQGKYLRVTVSRSGHSGSVNSAPSAQVTLPDLTGTVSVTGTAKVGETLTAVTASLGGSGTISYQWQRSDSATGAFAAISGATSGTYPITAADNGKYIRVTVSRAGYNGTVSSDAAGPVGLPSLSGTVSVSGTATVGQILTAVTTSLDGTGALSYRWQQGDSATGEFADISGATAETYTLGSAEASKYVRVTVSRAGYSGSANSNAAGPVVIPSLAGTVAIDGTTTAGETLTAITTNLGGSTTISYQWRRSDTATGTFADITGANDANYTLAAADAGKFIRVTASRAGYSGTADSAVTAAIGTATSPFIDGTVSLSGTEHVGQTLTANTGSLGGSGVISYQWERSDLSDKSFANIADATASSYALVAADLGKYFRVRVRRADNAGTVTSAATAQVQLPPLTGTVSVSGTAQVEQTLIANTSSLGGSGTISYRWQRGDSATGSFADIPGATGETYTLVKADRYQYIRVAVSRVGHSGTIPSSAIGEVAPQTPGSRTITIGFNYGAISITGNDGTNNIYRNSGTPDHITLSATGYDDVKWYVDGNASPAGTGDSITLYASAYTSKPHSITFAGKKDGKLYSQVIPFTVIN